MTPIRTPVTIRASRFPLGTDSRTYDGSYKPRPRRQFIVAVVECDVCGIRRECVNQVCGVCRANGAETLNGEQP